MLIPKAFDLTEQDKQKHIVAAHPLATVINTITEDNGDSAIDAQHIPLYWHTDTNNNQCLRGHIARANPLWRQAFKSTKTLCIFQGPQAYITPNWYPTKKQHGKAVPTWNFVAVHINGEIRFEHNDKWKQNMLVELTSKMENDIEKGQEEIWQLSDAPKDYIQKMLEGIVGVEIAIESVLAQAKLSQNQPQVNYKNIVGALKQSPQIAASAMSDLMED